MYVPNGLLPGTCPKQKLAYYPSYLLNPDEATLIALLATMTRLQAPHTRNFVYRHITADTSMAAIISTEGFQTFAFSMQLTVFSLRWHSQPMEDRQRNADGSSRERTNELGCLNVLPSQHGLATTVPRLYEGQVSFSVQGIDDHRYEAMVLVNSPFDTSLSTTRYHNLTVEGERPDPLTKGKMDVMMAMNLPPRDYYLRGAEVWLDYMAREWKYLVNTIETTMSQR